MSTAPLTYPDLEVDGSPIPPRSRLFALAPIGLGTPLVESLTSYLMRLAEAHSVWPKTLVEQEILPRFGRAYLLNADGQNRGVFWAQSTYMLNGMETWSQDWTRILVELTRQEELDRLTFQTWREVLASGCLLRRQRAWCPACYAEWAARGELSYEPLLWTAQAVRVCPFHRQPLVSTCPVCEHPMSVLGQRSQVGRCACCGTWLGQTLPTPGADGVTDAAVWAARAVGRLVAASSGGQAPPPRSQVAMAFRHYVKQIHDGGVCALARRIGVPHKTVGNWQHGQKIPQLGALLNVCGRLELEPLAVLTDAEAVVATHQLPTHVVEEPWHQRKNPKRKGWVEEMRARLATIVAEDMQPPPALSEVAWCLGYSPDYLSKRYPELCQILIARQGKQRRPFEREAIRLALEATLAEQAEPPPLLCEVARRLGYDHSHLRRYYPELCRAISARARSSNQQRQQVKIAQQCEEVRRVMYALHAEGRYPSSFEVGKALTNPHTFRDAVVQTTWRATLRELGWESS